MKRLSILLVAFLAFAVQSNAQKRSLEQMQDIAAQALSAMEGNGNIVTRSIDAGMELAMNSPELAVFNGSDGGWVMVSADERTAGSVLAYSTDGSFQWTSAPDNVKSWVEDYQLQIDGLDAAGGDYAPAQVFAPSDSPDVAPLIKTKWGQNGPYNKMCPTDSRGLRSVTGCLATAMAQIVNYWQYDTDCERGIHTNVYYPECTVDYSESEYDWSNMRDTYSRVSYSTQEANAVAKLMYDCGVAVDMSYSSSSSGAYNESVPQALSAFFGFSSRMQCCSRNSYSTSKWVSLLKNELDSKRPVLYSGHSESSGHAFVCDGYDIRYGGREPEYFFHFNWGWDGKDDGFFLLAALRPEEGRDYSGSQSAVINIRPAFDNDERPVWQDGFCFGRNEDNTFRLMAYDNNGSVSKLVTPQCVEADGTRQSYTIPTLFVAFSDFLTEVEINGATDIDANAFWNNKSLVTLSVGDSTKRISSYAFSDNKNLETVYLGRNVVQIRDYAFENCSGLKDVYCLSKNPPAATSNTFAGAANPSDMTLYVPAAYYYYYRTNVFWRRFGNIRKIDTTGVEVIGADAPEGPVFNLLGMPANGTATPNIYIQGGRKYIE